MSFIDKILDKMSLNSEDDEEFDNEDYYLDDEEEEELPSCLLYTSPSPRDMRTSRMPSSA